MSVEEIAEAIWNLTAHELVHLNELLKDLPGWGGAAVREPRKPKPESPGDALVTELPEDYWETAQ